MKEKRVGWHMYYATPMEGTEYRSLHTPLQIIYSDTKQNQLFSFIQFLSIIFSSAKQSLFKDQFKCPNSYFPLPFFFLKKQPFFPCK